MKKILFTLALSAVMLTGCEKEEPETETNTSTNSNSSSDLSDIMDSGSDSDEEKIDEIFTCKIDGQQRNFKSQDIGFYSFYFSNINVFDNDWCGSRTGKGLQIERFDQDNNSVMIELYNGFNEMDAPVTYSLDTSDYDGANVPQTARIVYNDIEFRLDFETGEGLFTSWHRNGNVSVTVTNTADNVIEGTFEGWLYNEYLENYSTYEYTLDSMHITEGKFKIKLVEDEIYGFCW